MKQTVRRLKHVNYDAERHSQGDCRFLQTKSIVKYKAEFLLSTQNSTVGLLDTEKFLCSFTSQIRNFILDQCQSQGVLHTSLPHFLTELLRLLQLRIPRKKSVATIKYLFPEAVFKRGPTYPSPSFPKTLLLCTVSAGVLILSVALPTLAP